MGSRFTLALENEVVGLKFGARQSLDLSMQQFSCREREDMGLISAR